MAGALTTWESSVNAVWVPMLAAVKLAQVSAAGPLNCTSTTYRALCCSKPDVAFSICSPLMIDLSSR